MWAHGLVLVTVALAAVIPLTRVGMLPLPGETRSVNFWRLWRALDYAYPYFDQKGADWGAVYEHYAPLVAQAESDEAYWALAGRMLAELNDGHTGLVSPPVQAGRRHFATCVDVGGAIVLDQVGATARAANLQRGDVVLAVDSLTIEEALRAGSTPQQRRARAAFHVLSTMEECLTVTVSGSTGERTVTLVWPEAPSAAAAPAPPSITGERLSSGLGLIRIPTFERNLVAEFDAALDGLIDAPGIVLDLRGNGGGSTRVSDPIVGRLLGHPFTYGREHFAARLPQRGWRAGFDYRARSRPPVYSGPLVLLIDVGSMSTAENSVVALADSGRATTVGRPTGGSSGNPIPFRLSGGGRARFSTGDFRRYDGMPIEGVGIAPDVPVAWTVEDVRAGRDPDLDAAVRLLLDR